MGGFGVDYLSATSSSESSWHQASTPSGTWTGHGPSMEDSSAVLMENLKVSRFHEAPAVEVPLLSSMGANSVWCQGVQKGKGFSFILVLKFWFILV